MNSKKISEQQEDVGKVSRAIAVITEIPIPKTTTYTKYIKRVMDILLSGCAILVLSPVLITVSILELIFHGWPIFYVSKRPGKDEKLFDMLKFRSMTNERDKDGKLLDSELRITPFGRLLRRSSIDELAGLFCVFTGKMSVIGPRPLLVDYLPLYSERHRYRHRVRPGLVCLRINGNDRISTDTWTWYDQFENDIFYVENVSMLLDIKMIMKAIKVAFAGSDMRTNAKRVRFNGENLKETRTKHEIEMTNKEINIQNENAL
jgi:undecaprenyl phosphate N,N'-diacetylbacillosamine 1-phosphate transferase